MKSRYSNGNIFQDVKVQKFPRHKFNKGYFNKLTCNHGLLVPFFCKDVVPGDRIDLRTFGRIQLQPLATSSMQNIKAYFRYFYVPYRLLWDKWDEFIVQDPSDESRFKVPYTTLSASQLSPGSVYTSPGFLMDYLNINLFRPRGEYSTSARISFNLFRPAAYQLIWDSYFRDENLQDPIFKTLQSGNQVFPLTSNMLLPVAYSKDYFTSALPWPQKGEPVNLNAYVQEYGLLPTKIDGGIASLSSQHDPVNISLGVRTEQNVDYGYFDASILNGRFEVYSNYRAQLQGTTEVPANTLATSININDLRYSNALQRFLERKALGGSRAAEFYLSMYGVRVDDLRIGMPKYLGGGYCNVSITDVASTAATETNEFGSQPVATLSGNGKAFPAVKINEPYYCQEFGIVMGVLCIRPELNYSQGLPKEVQLFDVLDFYNPIFAHLGEEAVNKSELVVKAGLVNDPSDPNYNDDTFGYQSRYAYLKHSRNEVHGDFKVTLTNWLLFNNYDDNVALNSDFISIAQDYGIFAVTDETEHHYMLELYNDFECESSMPDFAIPSL